MTKVAKTGTKPWQTTLLRYVPPYLLSYACVLEEGNEPSEHVGMAHAGLVCELPQGVVVTRFEVDGDPNRLYPHSPTDAPALGWLLNRAAASDAFRSRRLRWIHRGAFCMSLAISSRTPA